MKLDLNKEKLLIPKNYVLVKPDDSFETYQLGGKETGIIAPLVFADEKGNTHSAKQQHISIKGKVYAVPERLEFNGREIWKLQDKNPRRPDAMTRYPEIQEKIDRLRIHSVQYDVPMEVEMGDEVYFEYMAHMLADQEGLWTDTTEGMMMLIKYDMLILAVRNGEHHMLNGYLLVANEQKQTQQIEDHIEGEVSSSGIIISLGRKDDKSRKVAKASVVYCGKPCGAYLDERGAADAPLLMANPGAYPYFTNEDIKVGIQIQYDPRKAKELEYGLHRIFDAQRLLRIQRKDIQLILA